MERSYRPSWAWGVSELAGFGYFWCRKCKQPADPSRNYCPSCGVFHPDEFIDRLARTNKYTK